MRERCSSLDRDKHEAENKKGLEMSFATIFALIAGATILFLAIYFASRFIVTQQTRIDAQTAKNVAV